MCGVCLGILIDGVGNCSCLLCPVLLGLCLWFVQKLLFVGCVRVRCVCDLWCVACIFYPQVVGMRQGKFGGGLWVKV